MATPAPRTPRLTPELRREQLLDAALDVLAERGFGGLTVEAVAVRAGITRPVVYAAFGDLHGLVLALVDRAERTALGPLLEIVAVKPGEDADPDRFLHDSVLRFLRAVRADPRTWRLVLTPPRGRSPELAERIARSRRLVADHVQALLDWGITRRGGPRGLDHALAARLIVAAGEDAARLMLAHPRRFTPERFADLTAALVTLAPRGGGPSGAPPPFDAQTLSGAGTAGTSGAGAAGAERAAARPRRVPQAERREQLLDTALALAAEEGFGTLSMEAIARRAGVNRVVVYRSFANLHVLLGVLLRREDQRIMRTLERVIPPVPPSGTSDPGASAAAGGRPAEVLARALVEFLGAVLAAPERWRVALLRPESAPVGLQKLVNRRRAGLARRLEPLLEWSLAPVAGDRGAIDSEALARLLLSVCEEQARLALDDPEFPPRRLLEGSWALLDTLPSSTAARR